MQATGTQKPFAQMPSHLYSKAQYRQLTSIQLYSFAPLLLLASRSLSLNKRLRIFPLGLLGMTSMNSMPPFNHLCLLL